LYGSNIHDLLCVVRVLPHEAVKIGIINKDCGSAAYQACESGKTGLRVVFMNDRNFEFLCNLERIPCPLPQDELLRGIKSRFFFMLIRHHPFCPLHIVCF
jgi:hypothetical protein